MTIAADSDLAALDTVTANIADLVASIEDHHGALAHHVATSGSSR